MKKMLPPALLLLAFFGYLSVQLAWDTLSLSAQQSTTEQSKHQLFEALLRDLKLTTLDKKILEPKTLSTPIVVLNFWASWCLPCLKEFPSLVDFQKKYHDQISVIALNGDEADGEALVAKTKKKFGLDFYHVLDPRSEVSDKFHVSAYPFSVVYVRGKVIHVSQKIHDFMDKDFLAKVEAALTSK